MIEYTSTWNGTETGRERKIGESGKKDQCDQWCSRRMKIRERKKKRKLEGKKTEKRMHMHRNGVMEGSLFQLPSDERQGCTLVEAPAHQRPNI